MILRCQVGEPDRTAIGRAYDVDCQGKTARENGTGITPTILGILLDKKSFRRNIHHSPKAYLTQLIVMPSSGNTRVWSKGLFGGGGRADLI